MNELRIRPAEAKDLPDLDRLLYQVHKVHSDARPDLFKPGAMTNGVACMLPSYFSSAVKRMRFSSKSSARMEPLCPSAMLRAMESPMPNPPVLDVRD